MLSDQQRPGGDRMRFGICGAGFWAEEVHVPGLKCTDSVQLVGLWGRDEEARNSLARRHQIRSFPSFEAMLAEVDAVSFAVPPGIQATFALEAARAGKHLLLEKPLAFRESDVAALTLLVAEQSLRAACNLSRLHIPQLWAFLECAGATNPESGEAILHTKALREGSPYLASAWRGAPGASAWDLGPHALSVLSVPLGEIERIEILDRRDHDIRMRLFHSGDKTSTVSLSLRTGAPEPIERYTFASKAGSMSFTVRQYSHQAAFGGALGDLLNGNPTQASSSFPLASRITSLLARTFDAPG